MNSANVDLKVAWRFLHRHQWDQAQLVGNQGCGHIQFYRCHRYLFWLHIPRPPSISLQRQVMLVRAEKSLKTGSWHADLCSLPLWRCHFRLLLLGYIPRHVPTPVYYFELVDLEFDGLLLLGCYWSLRVQFQGFQPVCNRERALLSAHSERDCVKEILYRDSLEAAESHDGHYLSLRTSSIAQMRYNCRGEQSMVGHSSFELEKGLQLSEAGWTIRIFDASKGI